MQVWVIFYWGQRDQGGPQTGVIPKPKLFLEQDNEYGL
jgi:hypothetical protein